LFALITPFWSLFDQKASTWVLQADGMSKPPWFKPSHMQALNPALVMILIPFNNLVVFPWMRRRGWEPTALRRMTTGIALTGLSWVIVAIMQLRLDAGTQFSIVWQVAPYVVLTLGEVLVSATGLEFAYSQAPPAMKGTLMSFFNLTVAIGSLWVLLATASEPPPPPPPQTEVREHRHHEPRIIEGMVLDADTRQPIDRAAVDITSPAFRGERTVNTGPDGRFRTEEIPPGEFGFRCRRDG